MSQGSVDLDPSGFGNAIAQCRQHLLLPRQRPVDLVQQCQTDGWRQFPGTFQGGIDVAAHGLKHGLVKSTAVDEQAKFFQAAVGKLEVERAVTAPRGKQEPQALSGELESIQG